MRRLRGSGPRWVQEATLLATVIALSLAVWFVIVDAENREVEQRLGFSLSVGVQNLAADVALANEPLPVSVTVIGRSEDLDEVSPEDLEANVDAGGRARGRHSLPVRVESLVEGVRVRSVQPETAVVELQQVEDREVPVRVEAANSPPLGFSASAPTVAPQTATVTGASADVELVAEVVARLDLAGATVPMSRSAPLEAWTAAGARVPRVAVSPRFAQVSVEVVQELFPRLATVRPRVEGTPRDGFRVASITVDPPTVELVVTVEEFADAEVVETQVVRIDGQSATVERQVPLATATGEAAAETQVQVTVRIVPIMTELRVPVRIALENVPPGWQASATPASVTLTLRGPAVIASRIGAALPALSYDAAELGAGSHRVRPEPEVPDQLELAAVEPQVVTIELAPPPPEPPDEESESDG